VQRRTYNGNHLITQVEDPVNSSYGHGIKREIKFGDFLQNVNSNYLSTQYELEDGIGTFIASPLHKVIDLIPKLWVLIPELVPHLCNLWMGSTKSKCPTEQNNLDKNGTSSGLHHDFHDNFYFVISGRKKFSIFPPSDAHFMYLQGEIKTIFPNGMIEYVNLDNRRIREDGAFLDDIGIIMIIYT
jgi:hypothetical protein